MEDVIINIESTPIEVEVHVNNMKGDKGEDGSSFIEQILTVTNLGQTIFNISTISLKSNLIINGIEYFENESYTITNLSNNIYLKWLNEFELTTTDKLVLRRY